ncbi:MAG: LysE/ArgO family amino acid transporter [Pseudomonadota bacterium]
MPIFNDAMAGFLLGLSLIVAIGAQNVFVLQQGLRQSHVFWVCLTCAASDALLITVGVGGFHIIEERFEWITPFLTVAGAIFLVTYGAISAYRAIRPKDSIKVTRGDRQPLSAVLLTCLALTFLNPHVYLDTVVLMGAISTKYASKLAFGAGATFASFAFFFALGYGARSMAGIFESQRAWRVLDAIVALVMWSIAYRLLTY